MLPSKVKIVAGIFGLLFGIPLFGFAIAIIIAGLQDNKPLLIIWGVAGLIGYASGFVALILESTTGFRARSCIALGIVIGLAAAIPAFVSFIPLISISPILAGVLVLGTMWGPIERVLDE